MKPSPQISFTAGTLRVPVFVDPDKSDDLKFADIDSAEIFFVGYDANFRTCLQYWGDGAAKIIYPAITLNELTDALAGTPVHAHQ